MAMTTPALFSGSAVPSAGAANGLQRSTNSRTSFSLGVNHVVSSHRKSAVELLAETKAFYVKSETVRGRTQTLPLLSHNRNRDRNRTITTAPERYNLQSSAYNSVLMSVNPVGQSVETRGGGGTIAITSSLNRRSTGSSGTLPHPSNADMLQNALRKLLDCSSPVTSLENVAANARADVAVNEANFEVDCTTPISPPAEYAFCATASERRYTTRSLSHSQPVSASSTRSGGNSHPHENGCCSAHLVVLAKSLPDLHAARNLSSSYEGSSSRCYTGSRSNKSATSDVFSLNRDSGGDSSGHLTHRSEPAPRRQASHTPNSTNPNDKLWPSNTIPIPDLRRDSGSSTQHSGSYYHNSYYDSKHSIYDSKNYIPTYPQENTVKAPGFDGTNFSQNRSYSTDVPKNNSFDNKHFDGPKSAGYYDKNSPASFPDHDVYGRHVQSNNSSYFCRITKHGYPVPMSMARTEIVQSSNDQRIVLQNVRNSSNEKMYRDLMKVPTPRPTKSRSSSQDRQHSAAKVRTPAPVIFNATAPGEIILPPPIECCDNFQSDGNTFIDTIIPPPVFEMENELYESLEIKNVSDKQLECVDQLPANDNFRHSAELKQYCPYSDNPISGYNSAEENKLIECSRIPDNISESSFHENVTHKVGYTADNNQQNKLQNSMDNGGPMSLPFEDPELSPGLGTFRRQKCFRFKQKAGTGSNGRPILRSKSDISDRYRRNNNKNQPGVVRKSCGGEISRSISHLEQFFEQLGLNSDAYDNLFTKSGSSDDSESPVYFSDVSTVDSNRPVSQVEVAPDTCSADNTAGGGGGGAIAPPPTNIFRSSEPTSIVERNARIIKWMCNCRKAQLAGSTQGK